MTHRIRALVFLAAIASLAAIGTASAQAESLHSESATTFLAGEQIGTNTWDFGAVSAKCTTATFLGQVSGTTTEEVEVTPTYSGCTAAGVAETTDINGCKYQVTWSDKIVHIKCPKILGVTQEIEHTLKNCTITTPEQTYPFTNKNIGTGTSRDIEFTPSPTANFKYFVKYPGEIKFGCGTAGEHTDGHYTGSTTIKGYSDEARTKQVGIFIE